jgi:hypothetical protein
VKFGFLIDSLTLTGPGVAPAELRFRRGLNVITGPSDTGKTFIAQCVDFAMGGGSPPKAIPEADKYTSVHLGIETRNGGGVYVIERGLRGGDVRLSTPSGGTALSPQDMMLAMKIRFRGSSLGCRDSMA